MSSTQWALSMEPTTLRKTIRTMAKVSQSSQEKSHRPSQPRKRRAPLGLSGSTGVNSSSNAVLFTARPSR